jgi:hypothetical protein
VTVPAGKIADLKPERSSRPNWLLRWGCVFVVIAAALHGSDKPVGGGDTWVAMACGRYSVGPWAKDQPGRTWQMRLIDSLGIHITKQDFISPYSRPFVPGNDEKFGWVNQNWLTHVMFYKLKTLWGDDGPDSLKGESLIVIYKFIQAILTALFVYWAGCRIGAHPAIAAAMTAFAMLLSRSFIDMRPNITSIFFAAIMIFLLARWKQGRWWSLAWMIPVMIVWSNVHGGFIYAIMVFAIMSGGHLSQKLLSRKWPNTFVVISAKDIIFLLAAAVVITIIPAVFSPFGLENLMHPFIVATGAEGKEWREVSEWHPINQPGFGNVLPYFFYLGLLGLAFVMKTVLLVRGPKSELSPSRRSRQKEQTSDWPQIDLPQLAVMVVTLYMSIESRRFVFLGGVVLAPFLARMIQDIIQMIGLSRRGAGSAGSPQADGISSPPKRWEKILTASAWVAGLLIIGIFLAAMWDIYYSPAAEGTRLAVFRRMVGIQDQPVGAMQVLNGNKISGLVFNEWNQGGFIAFNQDPDPKTGQPPCRVYIDGRAQAAYALEHYRLWIKLRNLGGARNPDATRNIKAVFSRCNISSDDPQRFQKLVDRFKDDPHGYDQLILLSRGEPLLYSQLLKNEEVTAALLQRNYSYQLLLESKQWLPVYSDSRFGLLLRIDAPQNQSFFKMSPNQRFYPKQEIDSAPNKDRGGWLW